MASRYLARPSLAPRLATRWARLALVALPIGCQSASDAGDDTGSNPAAAAGSAGSNEPRGVGGAASSPSTDRPSRNAAAETSADEPDAAVAVSRGAGAAGRSTAAGPAAPSTPAQAFEACIKPRGAYDDCDTIYVTMTQEAPPRCVQLTIDDCGGYGRQGLAADVPNPWRLASGSVSASADACELGVFNPASASISEASGSVTWNTTTPLPTELVLELTLEASSSTDDSASLAVATTAPLEPADCAD
jgi:hypothetical protein